MKLIINYNNETYTINIDPKKSILDNIIDEEIDVPYACEAGSCGTCIAKLVKGDISMECQDGLSNKEINSNMILTCQAFLNKNSDKDLEIIID